jgi:uncharacterized repeat protein (TIGR01451 family)
MSIAKARGERSRARFPWARPRHELALLCVVGLTVLLPVYPQDPQDAAHICLADALAHGRVSADTCLSDSYDRSSFGGHLYSDKAPGLAVVELPSYELTGLGSVPEQWPSFSLRLWGVRLLSNGIAFLICAFLVGRVSEGLAPGFGAGALVAFSLGTLMAPFAATGFSHVLSATLLFGAFLLAWRRHLFLAGLVAGVSVLSDYECGLGVAIIAVYLTSIGRRSLLPYLRGVVPAVVLLGVYDWAAFGAPWRLSYHYVDNIYANGQGSGFFGIGVPHLVQTVEVLAGPGGLLVLSPVLVLALIGLFELGRSRPAEAITCGAIVLAFGLLNVGYFLPYGGLSPGPRFLIPSLPFLAIGFAPAFRRLPRLTAAATALSVASITAVMLVWSSNAPMRQTVWGELARVPAKPDSSRYVKNITETALHAFGLGKSGGALLVFGFAASAVALALGSISWDCVRAEGRTARNEHSRAMTLGLLASAAIIVGADVSAALAYPYGNRTAGTAIEIEDIDTTIAPSRTTAGVGDEVDFTITVDYLGNSVANQLMLTIDLPPGMRLLGPPAYTIGSGCTGTSTIVCNLDYLPAAHSTQVRLGVDITDDANQTIRATTTSAGLPGFDKPSVTIRVTRSSSGQS